MLYTFAGDGALTESHCGAGCTILAQRDVPAGAYVVHGNAYFSNASGSPRQVSCELNAGFPSVADATLIDVAEVYLESGTADRQTLSLGGVVAVPDTESLFFSCNGGGTADGHVSWFDGDFFAVKVGEVKVGPLSDTYAAGLGRGAR